MKGRMRPYLPELTIRDYNIYLRYLRGVRRQLYEAYGLYSCHLLRSNGVLFAILSDSLAGRQATCQRKRVPGTLAWRTFMAAGSEKPNCCFNTNATPPLPDTLLIRITSDSYSLPTSAGSIGR